MDFAAISFAQILATVESIDFIDFIVYCLVCNEFYFSRNTVCLGRGMKK